MYYVYYGDDILHDPYSEEEIIYEARCNGGVNERGTFEFTISPKHPLYSKLAIRSKEIKLVHDDVTVFVGYLVVISESFNRERTCTADGALAYLGDVHTRPYSTDPEEPGITVAPDDPSKFFEWLIDKYNARASHDFKIGANAATALNGSDSFYRSNTGRSTVSEEIEDKLIGYFGGYLSVRYEDGIRYLDYTSDVSSVNNQIIDFGVNLLDFTKEESSDNLYTAVLAVGGTDDKNKEITLSKYPDGQYGNYKKSGDVLINTTAVSKYGYKEYLYSNSDLLRVESLISEANKILTRLSSIVPSLTVKAVDLSLYMENYRHLRIGEIVRVRSKPHNIDQYMVVCQMDLDMENPENTEYVIGVVYDSLTGQQSSKLKSLNSSINAAYDEVDSISEEAKRASTDAENALASANQKRRIFYDVPVPPYDEGDLWTQGAGGQILRCQSSKAEGDLYDPSDWVLASMYGKAIYSTEDEFYESDSPINLEGGEWTREAPSFVDGKYIWRRTLVTYGDKTHEYVPGTDGVCISGNTGPQGEPGPAGAPGPQGETGEPGPPGASGKTSYFHVKYSEYADPKTPDQITETPSAYIGTCVDFSEEDPIHPSAYTWARFEGLPGEQGVPGENGIDGKTSYLHIAYANSGDGKIDFSISDSVGKTYLGQYVDFEKNDSADPSKYAWTLIKGEKGDQGPQGLQGLQGPEGEQGIPGTPGTNGKTSYFHVKYSSVSNPTSASQMTETPSDYIGTYVDFTEADSTDPKKYTWARFQGLPGEQGLPGQNGTDGKTYYLHIAYATSADGKTGFSTTDSTNKTYIGQYTDTVQNDSTDPSKYAWTLIKGDKGAKGDPGPQGEAGEPGTQGINLLVNTKEGAIFSGFNATASNRIVTRMVDPDTPSGYVIKYELTPTNTGLSGPWLAYLDLLGSIGLNKLTIGETYTLSFYAKVGSGTRSFNTSFAEGQTSVRRSDGTITTEWKKFTQVFKWTNSTKFTIVLYNSDDTLNPYILYVSSMKLEIGDVDNPVYSPATDDLRGTSILKVTKAPTTYTTVIGDFTPSFRMSLVDVKNQANIEFVHIGDIIEYNSNHYKVGYYDNTYVYLGAATSIQGAKGDKGDQGDQGTQGVNLALNSDYVFNHSTYLMNNYLLTDMFELNTDYTITVWGDVGSDRQYFSAFIGSGNAGIALNKIADGVWSAKYRKTSWLNDAMKNNANKLLIYQYPSSGTSASTIRKVKIEKGYTQEPVWSPAPSRGTGILKVTTAPEVRTTPTNGFTPSYRMSINTVKTQANVDYVLIGDVIEYDYNHYVVGYSDNFEYCYLGPATSIKGADGSGINLMRPTSDEWSDWWTPTPNTTNVCMYPANAYYPETLSGGDTFTCSIEIEFDGVTAGTGGAFCIQSQGTINGEWLGGVTQPWSPAGFFTVTTPPENGVYRYVGTYAITKATADVMKKSSCGFRANYWGSGRMRYRCMKMERGEVPNPTYTPAPLYVSSVDVEYYQSTSNTTQTGGSWVTTPPAWKDGTYMWSRTKTIYSDGSYETTNPICITGSKGATGGTGAAGKGVSSIKEQYYQSTSSTSQTGGSWVDTVPTWVDGKYIWTRSVITYTDNTSTTTTPVCVTGGKGSTGAKGDPGPQGTQGINLIRGTKDFVIDPNRKVGFSKGADFTFDVDSDGFTVASISKTGATSNAWAGLFSSRYPVKVGDVVTCSVWVMVDDINAWDYKYPYIFEVFNSAGNRVQNQDVNVTTANTNKPTIESGKWFLMYSWHTVTNADADTVGIRPCICRNGSIHFKKAKVEFGQLTMDPIWTPAPEDLVGEQGTQGINLALNSDYLYSNTGYPTGSYQLIEPFQINETYTLSVWGQLATEKTSFACYVGGGSYNIGSLTKISDGYYRVSGKITNTNVNGATFFNIYPMPSSVSGVTSTINRVKFEKGEVTDTTWTPAQSRGTGILKVTTAPTAYTATSVWWTTTPSFRMATSVITQQSGVDYVLIGDVVEYNSNHYKVLYVGHNQTGGGLYTYLGPATSIKGDTGPKGDQGPQGNDGANGKDGQMLYGTCGTAAATAAKVTDNITNLTLTALEKGLTVAIKFTYANTAANITLNVKNSSGTALGAKNVYLNGVRYAYWEANQTVIFTYDGTQWQIASTDVYANTTTIGNPAGQNVYIDSDSVDIRDGSTVNATFTSDTIELGKNSKSSKIKMASGNVEVGVDLCGQNKYEGMIMPSVDAEIEGVSLYGANSYWGSPQRDATSHLTLAGSTADLNANQVSIGYNGKLANGTIDLSSTDINLSSTNINITSDTLKVNGTAPFRISSKRSFASAKATKGASTAFTDTFTDANWAPLAIHSFSSNWGPAPVDKVDVTYDSSTNKTTVTMTVFNAGSADATITPFYRLVMIRKHLLST